MIDITKDDYGDYKANYTKIFENNDFVEIVGSLKKYHTGRDFEYYFEPSWFADESEENYYNENESEIEKQILDKFYSVINNL